MKVVLDTNVLLSFLHRDPKQRSRVSADLVRMKNPRFLFTTPVMAEITHFLERSDQIAAFERLLARLDASFLPTEQTVRWTDVIGWMRRYAQHEPDFADAHLVILSAMDATLRIWSYDPEFASIWRRPDGSAVPMAV